MNENGFSDDQKTKPAVQRPGSQSDPWQPAHPSTSNIHQERPIMADKKNPQQNLVLQLKHVSKIYGTWTNPSWPTSVRTSSAWFSRSSTWSRI